MNHLHLQGALNAYITKGPAGLTNFTDTKKRNQPFIAVIGQFYVACPLRKL